jgi:N-glycosidase YbiA
MTRYRSNPEFYGKAGAGILFFCQNQVLLLERSPNVQEPGTWGIPGGAIGEMYIQSEEDSLGQEHLSLDVFFQNAIKETIEELCGGEEYYLPDPIDFFDKVIFEEGNFKYVTFLARITEEQRDAWDMELNWENDSYEWFPVTDLPEPLHFGVKFIVREKPDYFTKKEYLTNPITSFKDEYKFLSNFYPSHVVYMGLDFPSVEHAYQAAKCENPKDMLIIQNQTTPGRAKRAMRKHKLPERADWSEIKLEVMDYLLRQKFSIPELGQKLLNTLGEDLVEENSWGDTFWGISGGVGHNHLGRLLMKTRSKLKETCYNTDMPNYRYNPWARNPLSEARIDHFRKLAEKFYLRPKRGGRWEPGTKRTVLSQEKLGPLTLTIFREESPKYKNSMIIFSGSPTGEHSLDGGSSQQRISAHWEGYVSSASAYVQEVRYQGGVIDRVIRFLDATDPTPRGKYANWLFKVFMNNRQAEDDVMVLHELLSEFDQKKHRLPQQLRDINSFDSAGDLSRALRDNFEESKRGREKRLELSGAVIVYEDDDFRITQLSNTEAAHRYGQKTRWCIKDEAMAKRYLESGPFYYIEVNEDLDLMSNTGPILAYSGVISNTYMSGHVEIKDVDNSDLEDSEARDKLIEVFKTLEPSFICSSHGHLKASECRNCGESAGCESCVIECTDCGNEGCEECMGGCDECGEAACGDCLMSCDSCGSGICRDCMTTCQCCQNAHICDTCQTECSARDESGTRSCAHLFGSCCSSDSSECAECDNVICKCCRDQCEECGMDLCEGCGTSCPECGYRVCKEHLEENEDGKEVCGECQ